MLLNNYEPDADFAEAAALNLSISDTYGVLSTAFSLLVNKVWVRGSK